MDASRRCLVRSESVLTADDDESSKYRRADSPQSLVGAISANDWARGRHSRVYHGDCVRRNDLRNGVIVGLSIFLLPTMVLLPKTAAFGLTTAVPGLINALLLVREFYPVAAIGGIVSVAGLLWSTRKA